ncbi:MAG: hypothetical protein A2Y62_07910 [Candidatus Fischerbacteria bacterium RBG_13_37_8]|uniref:Addiction module toxin, HicA family n=1 Tax=Candidatus Fischerbacteria bacterium RBG_13_37_8 TaxID=1817863 RepID=A0A1F5V588_9BACT|nr:MAG: hypothetical protein A2Y62_07910 [Candidatus Fischerbacteria bacterium RBG_13_37_8]
MHKQQRLTDQDAETLLLKAGFKMLRSKGSHRIYIKKNRRIVIPFHKDKVLHPKRLRKNNLVFFAPKFTLDLTDLRKQNRRNSSAISRILRPIICQR